MTSQEITVLTTTSFFYVVSGLQIQRGWHRDSVFDCLLAVGVLVGTAIFTCMLTRV